MLRFLFALVTTFRSLVNSNPRYVCWSAWVSSSPHSKYWWNNGCFFCVILRTEHFFGLKDISHLWNHSTTVSRSCCNPSASSFPLICRNRMQSSANNFLFVLFRFVFVFCLFVCLFVCFFFLFFLDLNATRPSFMKFKWYVLVRTFLFIGFKNESYIKFQIYEF